MPVRHRLSTTDDGRAVLIKHAPAGEAADRLAREAAALRAAAHPGVIELVAQRSLPGGAHELMLAMVGSRTAADIRVDVVGAAGLIAALAATVADLHDLGVAHGRIRAEHVLVDGDGRPVLCGFGEAVRAEPGALPTVQAAADVAGLGVLLRRLVIAEGGVRSPTGDGDDAWESIPVRRFQRNDRWAGHARRCLLNVADQATADDHAHRPSARGLAAAVLAALPEARLPGPAGSTSEADLPPPRSPWPARRSSAAEQVVRTGRAAARVVGVVRRVPVAPAGGAVGLGLLVFGISGLLRSPVPASSRPAASRPAPSTSTLPPSTSVPPTPAAAPTPAACPEVAPPSADPDGDGCASTVRIGDGWVEVDGTRFAVGAAGDLLAVGDWDCDGAATVAVVRRPAGEVFLFPGWATEGSDLVVPAAATVPSASSLAVDDADGDGCPSLRVVDSSGYATEVAP